MVEGIHRCGSGIASTSAKAFRKSGRFPRVSTEMDHAKPVPTAPSNFAYVRMLGVVLSLGLLMFVTETALAGVPPVSVVNSPYGDRAAKFLVRLSEEVAVPIEYAGDVFDVGDSLLLFDVSQKYYVALVSDGIEQRLVAVPRLSSSGQGTAWVSNEKELLFGARTRSVGGMMYLRRNEALELVNETATQMTVVIDRFGRRIELILPKRELNYVMELAPEPEAVADAEMETNALEQAAIRPRSMASEAIVDPIQRPEARYMAAPKPIRTRKPVAEPEVTFVKPSLAEAPAAEETVAATPIVTPTLVPVLTPVILPPAEAPAETDLVAASSPSTQAVAIAVQAQPPEPAPSSPVVAAVESQPTAQVVAAAAPAPATPPPAAPAPAVAQAGTDTMVVSFLSSNAWTFRILLLTVILESILILRLLPSRKPAPVAQPATSVPAPAPQPVAISANEVFSFTTVGESIFDASSPSYLQKDEGGDLQGTLDKFAMGHVVQFFHSTGESGTLTITGSSGQVDKLIFDRGHIIDAQCGNRCGMDAAEIILRRRQGSFRFSHEDNSARVRMIQQDTMSLLMEAHRLIDEKGWSDA